MYSFQLRGRKLVSSFISSDCSSGDTERSFITLSIIPQKGQTRAKVESRDILFVRAQYIMLAPHLAIIRCYPTISAANGSLQERSRRADTDCPQAMRLSGSQNLRSVMLQVFGLCAIIASQLNWEVTGYRLPSQLTSLWRGKSEVLAASSLYRLPIEWIKAFSFRGPTGNHLEGVICHKTGQDCRKRNSERSGSKPFRI
jgi:hypothetical protein